MVRLGHARTWRKRSGSAERAAECRTHVREREKPPRESETGFAHLGAGLRRPGAAPAQPIFIHTFWRGGGTYLWSKFRACCDALAFYEPFNESLGTASRAQLLAKTARSWPSKQTNARGRYLPNSPLSVLVTLPADGVCVEPPGAPGIGRPRPLAAPPSSPGMLFRTLMSG